MMNVNAAAAAGRAVNRGICLDGATNRLLMVMAGRRYDGNASMAARAAIRLAAKTWGITEDPPTQEGVT